MARPKREITLARCAGAALLAAIEVYNKPTVEYREQTFSMLMTNAWEVLLKARLVQLSDGKMATIFRREQGSRRYLRDAETKEPLTISLRETLGRTQLPHQVLTNIRGLMAIRNTSMHLGTLVPEVRRTILGFGTASVQNFIRISSQWFGEAVEAPYLLPVGFLGKVSLAKGIYPKAQQDLLSVLNGLSQFTSSGDESEYQVVMEMKVDLNRGLSGGGNIGITNDPSAPTVRVTDDEVLTLFPASYTAIVDMCKERYPGFKRNRQFHETMRRIKEDPKCAYERKLNPSNSKSAKTFFYNPSEMRAKLDDEYAQIS